MVSKGARYTDGYHTLVVTHVTKDAVVYKEVHPDGHMIDRWTSLIQFECDVRAGELKEETA